LEENHIKNSLKSNHKVKKRKSISSRVARKMNIIKWGTSNIRNNILQDQPTTKDIETYYNKPEE
jgi:hypothetical protein